MKRKCFFTGLIWVTAIAAAFSQHRVFMPKEERLEFIKRLEAELNFLSKQPIGLGRDTLVFRKLDTLYVQWSLMNPGVHPKLLRQSVMADSLNRIFTRHRWEPGRYLAASYRAQILTYTGKVDSAYVLISNLDRDYGHLLSPYDHSWLFISNAERLLYWGVKDHDSEAEDLLLKALELGWKYSNWEIIHRANSYLGDMHSNRKNYEAALPFFERQIPMFRLHGKINLGFYSEGANLANLIICYLNLDREEEASGSLELFFGENDPSLGAYANYIHHKVLSAYSSYFLKKERYREALPYEKGYTGILPDLPLQYHEEHYNRLYRIYRGMGDIEKALVNQEKWITIRDSLKTEELNKSFKEIESLYNLEKKNREIEQLQQEALLKENEDQRRIITVIVIISLLLIAVLSLWWRSDHLNRIVAQFKLDLFRRNQEISYQVIQTQNAERDRIAQDLHDDLGGVIATLASRVSRLMDYAPDGGLREEIESITGISKKAGDRIRQIAHNLMPPEFEKAGLADSVREFVLTADTPAFTFSVFGKERRLPAERELNTYRLITELIQNIRKHAGSTEGSVQLFFHDDVLSIVIEDNGLVGAAPSGKGIGQASIQARTAYLGARLLTDRSEKGTTQIVEVPY